MKHRKQEVWKLILLIVYHQKKSCQQKQWKNFVWVNDFLFLWGVVYLPVQVICWIFFKLIKKLTDAGNLPHR